MMDYSTVLNVLEKNSYYCLAIPKERGLKILVIILNLLDRCSLNIYLFFISLKKRYKLKNNERKPKIH